MNVVSPGAGGALEQALTPARLHWSIPSAALGRSWSDWLRVFQEMPPNHVTWWQAADADIRDVHNPGVRRTTIW